jgi:hypothetical protein
MRYGRSDRWRSQHLPARPDHVAGIARAEEATMSYQPYPTSGGEQLSQGPAAPKSVLDAVKVMYAGAGLSVVGIILVIATSSSIKNAFAKANASASKPLTASQLHSLENAYIVAAIVILAIGAALWFWMARANGAGRRWARITSSVFFGIYTIYILTVVTRSGFGVTLILAGLSWLVGLWAIVLLWRRESSEYFNQSS